MSAGLSTPLSADGRGTIIIADDHPLFRVRYAKP